jgi:hypothetical protein
LYQDTSLLLFSISIQRTFMVSSFDLCQAAKKLSASTSTSNALTQSCSL